jgi:hypothetical protein
MRHPGLRAAVDRDEAASAGFVDGDGDVSGDGVAG